MESVKRNNKNARYALEVDSEFRHTFPRRKKTTTPENVRAPKIAAIYIGKPCTRRKFLLHMFWLPPAHATSFSTAAAEAFHSQTGNGKMFGSSSCLAASPLFPPFSLASPPLFSTFHDILPPYREKSLGKKERKGPPEELESLSTYPSRYFCSFFVVK